MSDAWSLPLEQGGHGESELHSWADSAARHYVGMPVARGSMMLGVLTCWRRLR